MLESSTGPRSGRVQSEEDLPYRLAARLVGAHYVEAALDKHADAGWIVLGHAGMRRALGDFGEIWGQGGNLQWVPEPRFAAWASSPRSRAAALGRSPGREGRARGCRRAPRTRTP